tara:strand:+ start:94138 stop:95418 length:1281 start_codon:yes stop_codon:yes gene_type:complete
VNQNLYQKQEKSLLDDKITTKKLEINLRRNREQDNGDELDKLARDFVFEDCRDELWNPEKYSLLYATPLWHESSPSQKILLNQLYWVAYYSQIISAEIATIFLNQTSAAGLYSLEDFRLVCDTLDLESMQERGHINAFKTISEQVEEKLFGERLFTYPMKNFATETMIFQNTNRVKEFWKWMQLNAFSFLSSNNAFIACQYFTVRGLRTLKGKIVQHELGQYYDKHPDKINAPIPSKISYHHFLDESYHFNSSSIIGHDVIHTLKGPTKFESHIANMGIKGCQKDHQHFNISVNGIFWYEPALFPVIYRVLRSPYFEFDHVGALQMMEKCFLRENQAMHLAYDTHCVASKSYQQYVDGLPYISKSNREMKLMKKTTIEKYIRTNKQAFKKFEVESERYLHHFIQKRTASSPISGERVQSQRNTQQL